jgi:hypothetical protein
VFLARTERAPHADFPRSLVTLASMMFMITIPPTTRNTLTIPIAAEASVPVKSCHKAMIESEPRMAKLSSAL